MAFVFYIIVVGIGGCRWECSQSHGRKIKTLGSCRGAGTLNTSELEVGNGKQKRLESLDICLHKRRLTFEKHLAARLSEELWQVEIQVSHLPKDKVELL